MSSLMETLRAACLQRGAAGIHGIGRYTPVDASLERIFTSAKKVMFLPDFVCLFVCLSVCVLAR